MPRQNDRYEPLPGLLSLPGFLYRKLGPRGRVAFKIGSGLFLVAVVVAAIVLVPRIVETKRERAERDRREAAAALAERRRELIAEQRPHRASVAEGAPRTAVVTELEERIRKDARARVAAGTLSPPAPKRVQCEPIEHGQDPAGDRVVFDCLAVTSDLPSSETLPGGVIGHPFRGVAEFAAGRLTWCKISGRTVEGQLRYEGLVGIPPACSL